MEKYTRYRTKMFASLDTKTKSHPSGWLLVLRFLNTTDAIYVYCNYTCGKELRISLNPQISSIQLTFSESSAKFLLVELIIAHNSGFFNDASPTAI